MLLYSIYLIEESVELCLFEQEHAAIAKQGRFVSMHKNYQQAQDTAIAIAKENQFSFVDRTEKVS